jgi:hypothetical protein
MVLDKPPPPKGDSRLVLRDFLESGSIERPGYGAYSYVLVPKEPTADERYVALLTAYLALPPDEPNAVSGSATPLQRRNLTYAPVRRTSSPAGGADWLIKNYDVSRAAMLLDSQCLGDAGPYILIATTPLSLEPAGGCGRKGNGQPVDLAVLDLSRAPKESMRPWLDYFVRESQKPEDWSRRKVEWLLLKLHDHLDAIGTGATAAIEAIGPAGKILKVLSSSD